MRNIEKPESEQIIHWQVQVRFVYINSDIEENWQIIEFLGLIAEDVPGVLFIGLKKHFKKYKAEMKEVSGPS